jgi:hypothetical protein
MNGKPNEYLWVREGQQTTTGLEQHADPIQYSHSAFIPTVVLFELVHTWKKKKEKH